jgi:hypothetical protein
VQEYDKCYGLTEEKLANALVDCLVLGVQAQRIECEAVDIAVRMAVLSLIAGVSA